MDATKSAALPSEKKADHSNAKTPTGDIETPTKDNLVSQENSVELSECNTVVERVQADCEFVFFKCRFCGLTFNYATTLKAHERVHNVELPYTCSKCSESFHFLCELEYHLKQHSDMKGFKCECGRTFHTYTDLLYHAHPGEGTPQNSAEVVNTTQGTSSSKIPETEFPVPNFAEKGFEPKHPMKVYSDVRSRPYICQYCSKSYADSRGLTYHMYSHRGERIFNPRASRWLMSRSEV
ncbi:hypothetical protein AB6A40_003910 [Gnathostoma spinigerum]|uniref:Zinc finger protein unc-98 n=1 Tax=Gnathostoma spinigerum TaxID=75299 RepID=A0ABD6EIJ1_9BILA